MFENWIDSANPVLIPSSSYWFSNASRLWITPSSYGVLQLWIRFVVFQKFWHSRLQQWYKFEYNPCNQFLILVEWHSSLFSTLSFQTFLSPRLCLYSYCPFKSFSFLPQTVCWSDTSSVIPISASFSIHCVKIPPIPTWNTQSLWLSSRLTAWSLSLWQL